MKLSTKFVLTVTSALTLWQLTACAAPTMEGETMSEPTSVAMSASEAMTDTMVMTDTMAMTDTMVMTDTMAMTDEMTDTMTMTDTKPMTEEAAMADEMLMLRGELVGLGDGQHEGSGTVQIVKEGDGYIVQFTNFTSSEGPDLHVALSPSANPIADGIGAEWLDLGVLQATSGDQSYTVPADTDLSRYQSVVVYCVSFDFIFSAATLQ
jgi:hypothetical protein